MAIECEHDHLARVCPRCEWIEAEKEYQGRIAAQDTEIARLRKAIVFAAKHGQGVRHRWDGKYHAFQFGGPPEYLDWRQYDGTDAGLVSAVLKAMEGE